MNERDAFSRQAKQLGVLMTVPILLLCGPAVGFALGYWIDRKFQIYPWMSVVLAMLGLVAAGREVARLLRQILKDEAEKK